MEYHIVSRVTVENNQLVYTSIGYLTSSDDVENIKTTCCMPFMNWKNTNLEGLENGSVLVDTYFNNVSNPDLYDIGWATNNIDGLELPLITDINNLDTY